MIEKETLTDERPPPVTAPSPSLMDWSGFDGEEKEKSGRITCRTCQARWIVPRCWLKKPPPACRKVLEAHRLGCPVPAPVADPKKEG